MAGLQRLGIFVAAVESLPECKLQLASAAARPQSKLKLALRQSARAVASRLDHGTHRHRGAERRCRKKPLAPGITSR
jgi:hypothetical protein